MVAIYEGATPKGCEDSWQAIKTEVEEREIVLLTHLGDNENVHKAEREAHRSLTA